MRDLQADVRICVFVLWKEESDYIPWVRLWEDILKANTTVYGINRRAGGYPERTARGMYMGAMKKWNIRCLSTPLVSV